MTTVSFDLAPAVEILSEATGVSSSAIASAITKHVEDLIEEILSDPESHFRHEYRFWRKLDQATLIEEEREQSIAA